MTKDVFKIIIGPLYPYSEEIIFHIQIIFF